MQIACRDIAVSYPTRRGRVAALDGVTLTIAHDEFVCLLGPSGCGKTTLLKVIAGLIVPARGSVEFVGKPGGNPLSAMVFQDHGLFPWMTVEDNITFGLEMRGMRRGERRRRALPLIERAGLGRFLHSYPHELSIGMKQRAGLIRAFVTGPQVLLMDEPFAALDAQTKLVLQDELLRILRDHPKPVVYVTHDMDEAILLGDRIVMMTGRPGQVRAELVVAWPRPRTLDVMRTPEFAALKGRAWTELEAAARTEARQ